MAERGQQQVVRELPEALRAAERMLLRGAVDGSIALPPYPAVALRAQDLMRRKDFGLRDVARLVSADATLTASLLRCAGSALYGRGEPVRTLAQAVTRLGADEVTRVTLAAGLGAQVQAAGPLAPLRRAFWIDALSAAVLSQRIARVRGLRAEGEAFVAGMLHDFGKVIAAARLEAMLASTAVPAQPAACWEALVERVHVALGVALAASWQLPPHVRQVIAHHHGETAGACQDPALLDVVRAADEIVALLATRAHVDAEALSALPGLSGPSEPAELARVVAQIPPVLAAFEGAPPPASRSWALPPRASLAPGERAVDLDVVVEVARKPREYTASVMAPNGLVLFGLDPLPEHFLVQATLQCEPAPFRIWAVARLCRPRRAVHRVELQAFALSGDARARWDALYRRASAAARP